MTTIHGLDISKYAGPVGLAEWQRAYKEGQRVAVVGSWHGVDANHFAFQNLDHARLAGFLTATYIVLNALDGAEAVKRAAAACGSEWEQLKFVALDIEVDGVTWGIIADAKAAIGRVLPKAKVCIYTGSWFWRGHLNNPTWGIDLSLPLWDSRYDGQPDLAFPDPYGCWTELIGRQYQGTNKALGFSTDLSVFDSAWING